MIDLDQSESEDIINYGEFQQDSGIRLCFRKYAVVYRSVKSQSLKKIENWTSMIKNLSKQKKGFKSIYVLNFLANIGEKDSQYRLQRKQFASILQEIVEMFRMEVDRILSEENNEYQIISQQNCRMFKEFNRLNQFTEPLCYPKRLIGLDVYACLHEINYICQHSQPNILRQITSTLMSEITRIQQIKHLETTLKIKWEENFGFLSKEMNESFFGVLSEILFLVHLKRKISFFQSKDATLQLNDKDRTPFQVKLPQQKCAFRNSDRFKYKFCELAVYNPTERDIARKSNLAKTEISRKIQLILERSQQSNQCLELRALMLQHKVSFKALSEWINSLSGVTFPKPKQIFQMLKKCQWNLLKNDSFDVLTKNSRLDSKEVLSTQNFIGESICKIALERFRKYSSVLKIQNKLMKKIEKGTSLYVKRFKYSYKEYYYIHHKDISGSTCASLQRQGKEGSSEEQNDRQHKQQQDNLPNQEFHEAQGQKQQKQAEQGKLKLKRKANKKGKPKENSKGSLFTTIILGFSGEKDQFAFKYNEQLHDGFFIQHLVNFLKVKHGPKYNVFLSEVDFERNGIVESTFAKMVELFKAKLHNFVKFEGCPSKFFYHLLVHTYVDKCLNQTPFENENQFSEIISSAVLRIIRLINFYIDTEMCQSNIKDNCYDPQEQSCEQSDTDVLLVSSEQKSDNVYNIDQNYSKFDQMKIRMKIRNILMKKMSFEASQFDNISWQGIKKYTKKGNICQYYLKLQNKDSYSKNNENSGIITLKQAPPQLEQEISDVQNRLLKLFEKSWPFLTDLQISNKIQNLVSFLKEVNSGIKEIKALFRNITRNLIIYQAYFNELFCSKSEQSKDLKEKYQKEINFLVTFYNKQVENSEKELPGMLFDIFMKLLNNFARFPVTSKKIRSYCNSKKKNTSQPILKVQYKEEDYPEPFKKLEKQQQ